jgi:hypothetical protein
MSWDLRVSQILFTYKQVGGKAAVSIWIKVFFFLLFRVNFNTINLFFDQKSDFEQIFMFYKMLVNAICSFCWYQHIFCHDKSTLTCLLLHFSVFLIETRSQTCSINNRSFFFDINFFRDIKNSFQSTICSHLVVLCFQFEWTHI